MKINGEKNNCRCGIFRIAGRYASYICICDRFGFTAGCAASADSAERIDSLTIQPGETSASINLNWYAPEGTANSVLPILPPMKM